MTDSGSSEQTPPSEQAAPAAPKAEGKPMAEKTPSANKVFVGGLSWETHGDRLRTYFENFGAVREAFVSYNRNNGRPRGFGFVVFESPEVVDKVVAAKHMIDRREVEAKRAVPKDESTDSKQGESSPTEANSSSSGPQKTKKVFVGGLAPSVDEAQLREHFSQFGEVEDAVVMYDHENKRPRGFGFVTFINEDSVDKVFVKGAVQTLADKPIEIKAAVPRDQMPAAPRMHHHPAASYYQPRNGPPMHYHHGPGPRGGYHYGPPPGGYGPPPYGGYGPRGPYPGGRGGQWGGPPPPHVHHQHPGHQHYGPPPPRGPGPRHQQQQQPSGGYGGGSGGYGMPPHQQQPQHHQAQQPHPQQGMPPSSAAHMSRGYHGPPSVPQPQQAPSQPQQPQPAPPKVPAPVSYDMYSGLPNGVNANAAMLSTAIYANLAGIAGIPNGLPNPGAAAAAKQAANLNTLNHQLKALNLTSGLAAAAGFSFPNQGDGSYQGDGAYANQEDYTTDAVAQGLNNLSVNPADYNAAFHEAGGFTTAPAPGWSS